MKLKKSYKGFIVWLLVFVVSIFVCAFLPIDDGALITRILLNACMLELTLLTYIIYKTGYVYWYTGVNYEDAVNAGEIRRKEYGLAHFKLFWSFNLLFIGYSILSHLVNPYFWIDMIVLGIGVVVIAIRTMKFQL